MPGIRKFKIRSLLAFLFVLTLISYSTVFISPALFWPIGLFNYVIPVLITLQFILFMSLLFFKKQRKLSVWPLVAIVAGFYFVDNTFNFPHIPDSSEREKALSVLSFNTRFFRERKSYDQYQPETIDWAINEDSDIKCFQEYSTHPTWGPFKNTSIFLANGYYSHIYTISPEENNIGLAIFSRYPIVNKGIILLNKDSHNNCIYADIKVDEDTIRVYNFHLKSMGLRLGEFKKPRRFSDNSKETVTKLGSASSKRAVELHKIIQNIKECPHPYILAGDFNELIYGNNYYKIQKIARNTFEEVGSGFGFTFNSILFFIRIDHQFHSKGIMPVDFRVINEIKSSDHFPVKGWYKVK